MRDQNIIPTKYRWTIIIVIALILLIIPMFLRENPFSSQTYERVKVQNYGTLNLYVEDTLVKEGRTLLITPYDLIIMLLKSVPKITLIIPFILGILSVIIFKLILKEFRFSENRRFFILLFFVMTPAFIFTFSLNNYYSMVLFLNFLGMYLFIKKKNKTAITIYTILVFFGIFDFLMSMLILLLIDQKLKKGILKKIVIPGLAFLGYLTFAILKKAIFLPKLTASLDGILADIGPLGGISLFAIILAVMGWGRNWRNNKKALAVLFLIIIIAVFYTRASYFLFPLIALLSASGLILMLDKPWSVESLKTFTILIFLLGILFSVLSYETKTLTENPTEKVIQGLEFLQDSSTETEIVLTAPSRAGWVQVFAERPVIVDLNPGGIADYDERVADIETVFHTYDMEKVRQIFKKYDIEYVVVDKELTQGLVWEKQDQELLYLMTDKNTFNKIYANSEIIIWQFIE